MEKQMRRIGNISAVIMIAVVVFCRWFKRGRGFELDDYVFFGVIAMTIIIPMLVRPKIKTPDERGLYINGLASYVSLMVTWSVLIILDSTKSQDYFLPIMGASVISYFASFLIFKYL
ncbi:MAG: hypothetical protein NTW04_02775 [Elusimicrobia bacterium]|nr:hypothetical protein [Elusimicrobiota bacterium]